MTSLLRSIVADPATTARPGSPKPGGTVALPPAKTARASALLIGLTIALLLVTVVAAGKGQLEIPTSEVLGSVLRRLGIEVLPDRKSVV